MRTAQYRGLAVVTAFLFAAAILIRDAEAAETYKLTNAAGLKQILNNLLATGDVSGLYGDAFNTATATTSVSGSVSGKYDPFAHFDITVTNLSDSTGAYEFDWELI